MAREKMARRSVTPQPSIFSFTDSGWVFNDESGEALLHIPGIVLITGSLIARSVGRPDMFHTLFHPSENILPEKQQHTNLLVTSGEHPALQSRFLLGRRHQPLQSERRERGLRQGARLLPSPR